MEDLPDDPTENPHMRVARFRKRIAALEAANRELRARVDMLEALLDLSAGKVLEIDWRKRLEAALARKQEG